MHYFSPAAVTYSTLQKEFSRVNRNLSSEAVVKLPMSIFSYCVTLCMQGIK